jgi:DNA-binding IclR family transcriptional regulator
VPLKQRDNGVHQSDGRGEKVNPSGKPAKRGNSTADRSVAKSSQTRVLDLLQMIAASERPLSLPELSLALVIPKPTVFRLCQRLEGDGYLEREPGGRHFNVGPSLVRLGLHAIRTGGSKLERHAILQTLVDTVGETCNFTTRAGTDVLYLDRVETRWPLRLHLEPGSRVPIHCTSSGKIFLAHMSKAERNAVLGQKKLAPHTPSTITSRKDLDVHLETILAKDYSVDNEEFLLGLVAVAVPIRDAAGNVVAALACHAPVARMPVAKAIKLLPHIRIAAAKLAETLPFVPAKSR